MKVKIVKEVKRSDGLWRFASGDVYFITGSVKVQKKILANHHWVLTKIKSSFNLAHLASSYQVCSVLTYPGEEEKPAAKNKDENAKVLPKIPNYAAETFVCLLRSWPRWTEQQQEQEFEICTENIIHVWSAKKVNRTIRWNGCSSFSVKNIRTFGWH